MKILHITKSDTGGAGGATVRTHIHLLNANVDSSLLVLNQYRPEIHRSYSFTKWQAQQDNGIINRLRKKIKRNLLRRRTLNKIKNLPKGQVPFNFPLTPHEVENHPIVQEANIIVLHWIAGFINYPTFFKKVKKPIVWRLPDMFPFTGGYHYEKFFPTDAYSDIIEANLKIKKAAVQGSHIHLVPLCCWMDHKLEGSIFKGFPKSIIPNGIDTEIFQPRDIKSSRELFGLPQDKQIILFVSDSVESKRKGFSMLLEAFHSLSFDHLHLAILGAGTPDIHLPKKTYSFLGKIKDERLMSAAYSASDLFVIPSLEDNLPNTVIESIACGTPVVGFHIGGIPDMIIHGKNGFLCEEPNAEKLAAIISKALKYNFNEESIRQDAVERFDQSVQAKKYTELFESILARR